MQTIKRIKKAKSRHVDIVLLTLSCICLILSITNAQVFQNRDIISLNGQWNFALDPGNKGEAIDWHEPWQPIENSETGLQKEWDTVTVPHCFSVDKRYEGFIGKVWYKRVFQYTGDLTQKHLRLRFEAIFYQCDAWLNGQYLGTHEGGYTPFEYDISEWVKPGEDNFLSIRVNNSWDRTTLPGAREGKEPKYQVYPWLEYGGITRDVGLLETHKIYIEKQKIEATPNLNDGTAKVRVVTWVNNEYHQPVTFQLNTSFSHNDQVLPVEPTNRYDSPVNLAAESTTQVVQTFDFQPSQVALWHFADPNLYIMQTTLLIDGEEKDLYRERFGIRKVDIQGSKLLLNGDPTRLGGANRHSDHPVFASMDNPVVAEQDLTLFKEGNMELTRLQHIPPSKAFMDWCDENGMLIIAEAGNWQIPPQAMADPVVRAKYQQQAREIIERDWNRPSIIGYSVGNEYHSWTEAGDAWTKRMIAFTKALDSTRFCTFAALGRATHVDELSKAHDSFRYCDLLSFNFYGNGSRMLEAAERLHQKYPDKPIMITEYGKRADQLSEEKRIEYFKEYIDAARQKDYIVGASWWSFNDYRSKFYHTNTSGFRPWGIVDEHRTPRKLYWSVQEELAPFSLEVKGRKVTIKAKGDFPSYTLEGYQIKFSNGKKIKLNTLAPGQMQTVELPKGTKEIQVLKPNHFIVLTRKL
ncbi:MAG: glycosyl hydrolase [Cytophagales bacterium]|nr:glycosyl hydrolase [Cytophagales bacterium]